MSHYYLKERFADFCSIIEVHHSVISGFVRFVSLIFSTHPTSVSFGSLLTTSPLFLILMAMILWHYFGTNPASAGGKKYN
jgi:hypothetical protein